VTPNYDGATFDAWRVKAEEDLTAGQILAEHNGPAATICFLSQQVAEKYLKGYLMFHRQPLQRIHQLDVLLERCITLDGYFREVIEDAIFLKRYYIASRYPDDLPEDVTRGEAEAALAAAWRIRDCVLTRIASM
jgi:HEPN domain-containing protein